MTPIKLKYAVWCRICEEPIKQYYKCAECGVEVCSSCVCSDGGLGTKPLCPECPGAAIGIAA